MIRFIIFCFCILTLFSAVLCEVIPKLECGENENKNCKIKEVRITPCKEASKTPPQACKFKRNKSAELEVDFEPNFVATNLTAQLYWVNGILDVALPNMDTDACKTTQCPTAKSTQQTYKYTLKIDKFYPLSFFEVKFVMHGDDVDNQQCCFQFKSKISK